MKRVILTVAFALMTLAVASAQRICVVDSERIFKSLNEYNRALSTLDELGKAYQNEVDNKYKNIENLYNNYMAQKSSLSPSVCASIEQQILQKEEEVQKYQQAIFGENGTLMQKRMELIKPIQTKVFAAIERYAQINGYDLIIDKAANASILYSSNTVDRTVQVIAMLQ